MKENAIEWIKGSKTATVTASGGSSLKWRIKKLAAACPDSVKIMAENEDGSVLAYVPVKYISVRKPRERHLTEEQKRKNAERLKAYRERHKKK